MIENILGCTVSEGVEFIKRLLDDNYVEYEYVFHAEKIHQEKKYIVPVGIPVVFIQKAGLSGYILNIDTLDEDFNRVEGYAIKMNCPIEEVHRVQQILNILLVQH